MMVDDRFYRKHFDQTLLRCVTHDKARRILHEFHYEFSRGHYSGPTTATKILQVEYYWPTIFKDSFKIFQEYDKCSRFVGKKRQATIPLKLVMVEEPF